MYERAVILDPGMLRTPQSESIRVFILPVTKKTTFQSKGLKLLDKIKILLIFCLYSIAFPHVYFIVLYFISFNVYVKPFELPCDKMCCTNKLVFLSLALPRTSIVPKRRLLYAILSLFSIKQSTQSIMFSLCVVHCMSSPAPVLVLCLFESNSAH